MAAHHHPFFAGKHSLLEQDCIGDADLAEIATLEYEYLPLLEFEAEPVALNQILAGSPEFFVKIICDAFAPTSGPKERAGFNEPPVKYTPFT